MTFAARTLMGAGAGGGGGGGGGFTPVTHLYSAAGTITETIPGVVGAGPVQVEIELGGPGGGGSFSPHLTRSPPTVSGSGGSGSLCRATFALTPADWGKTFNVTISPGADGGDPIVNFNGRAALACTIVNGTFATPVHMQAGGGAGGTWNPGAGGAGGVASGGQVNLSGNVGQGNALVPTHSRGGVGIIGDLITSGAGGDASVSASADGDPGQSGGAAFAYT